MSLFIEAFLAARKQIKEDRQKLAAMQRTLRRNVDYQFLQELLNACPNDMEMKIGPLADGSFITLRRVYEDRDPTVKGYRESESRLQQILEQARAEGRL